MKLNLLENSKKINRDFPFLSLYDYWESSSVGPTLLPVIRSIREYYENMPFNYGVGTSKPAKLCYKKVEESYQYVAQLINAEVEEISLYPKNATEALQIIIEGLNWEPGDEIVGCNIDHYSTYLPSIRLMNSKGVKFKLLKADKKGFVKSEDFENTITDKTKLVIICHASNIFGSIANAKRICSIATKKGSLSLVDACQTVGRIPIDVKDIGCDFLAFCGRKHLCGPQGSAVLYIKKDLINVINPIYLGGTTVKLSGDYNYEIIHGMNRFNAGSVNVTSIIGLGASVNYWLKIGIENVRFHICEILKYLFCELKKINAIVYSPQDIQNQVGIISFRLPNVHPDKVAEILEHNYKIIIRSGSPGSPIFNELGVDKINRMAPHYYIDGPRAIKLVEALNDISNSD